MVGGGSGGLAEIAGAGRPTIRIWKRFAAAIEAGITEQSRVIATAAFDRRQTSQTLTSAAVSTCVDAAARFVILHEMFHLLSGHVGLLRARAGKKRSAFDELSIGAGRSGAGGASEPDLLQAYYLEIEADNTALQWLMQEEPLDVVSTMKRRREAPVADLTGRERVIGFRLLVATIWLVIRHLEARRSKRTKRSDSHPLPAARVLAAIGTIGEQFAELTELRSDREGQMHQVLSAAQADALRVLFRQVLRPVMTASWSHRKARPFSGINRTLPLLIVDLAALLQFREPTLPPGIELRKLERLRLEMTRTLAPHRIFSTRPIEEGTQAEGV